MMAQPRFCYIITSEWSKYFFHPSNHSEFAMYRPLKLSHRPGWQPWLKHCHKSILFGSFPIFSTLRLVLYLIPILSLFSREWPLRQPLRRPLGVLYQRDVFFDFQPWQPSGSQQPLPGWDDGTRKGNIWLNFQPSQAFWSVDYCYVSLFGQPIGLALGKFFDILSGEQNLTVA